MLAQVASTRGPYATGAMLRMLDGKEEGLPLATSRRPKAESE